MHKCLYYRGPFFLRSGPRVTALPIMEKKKIHLKEIGIGTKTIIINAAAYKFNDYRDIPVLNSKKEKR